MLQFFRAEVYVILACAYEIQTRARPEKYFTICADSQAVQKALQAAKTSPLVCHCQKALIDISTVHAVGLYWVPEHAAVRRHTVGLYWVLGHVGIRRHIVGIYCIPKHAEVRRQIVRLFWVPGHAGVRGHEITGHLARDGAVQKCVGPEPSLGISRQNMRRKTNAGWITSSWQWGAVVVLLRGWPEN
jgi:ribonuclease HI